MKKVIVSAVVTGITVTAGIFGLQEYRQYEAEQAQAAIVAAKEAERRADIAHMHACIDRVVNELFEKGGSYTSDDMVKLSVELKCPGAYGFMGVSRMEKLKGEQ